MNFYDFKKNETIREHLKRQCKFCPSKPLWERGIEGIRIEVCNSTNIDRLLTESKIIGEEVFTLTDRTFITDANLLKYVDKPIAHISGTAGIGLDGKNDRRRWSGCVYYVLSPEEFE